MAEIVDHGQEEGAESTMLEPSEMRWVVLSNYQIKLIAAIAMVIDHVGVVFFPEFEVLRWVGRLSFPLFAWLLSQGEQHTSDVRRYLLRLLLWGVVTQPIYILLFQVYQLNVLFTLLTGLLALRLGKTFPNQRYVIWVLGLAIASLIPMDAGGYGVAVILLLAHFKPNLDWWLGWLGLHVLYLLITMPGLSAQIFALPAPLLIYGASRQLGQRARWFYFFYPGHLLALLGIKVWLEWAG